MFVDIPLTSSKLFLVTSKQQKVHELVCLLRARLTFHVNICALSLRDFNFSHRSIGRHLSRLILLCSSGAALQYHNVSCESLNLIILIESFLNAIRFNLIEMNFHFFTSFHSFISYSRLSFLRLKETFHFVCWLLVRRRAALHSTKLNSQNSSHTVHCAMAGGLISCFCCYWLSIIILKNSHIGHRHEFHFHSLSFGQRHKIIR